MKIQDRAMLTGVFTSLPGLSKKDKKVTEEVTTQHGAGKDAGEWRGKIWPDAAVKPVKAVAALLKAEVNKITGPYFVDGLRILPSTLFMEATEKQRKIQPMFDQAADESANKLDDWIEEMRQLQNGMFRRELYPNTATEFRRQFKMEVKFLPLPDEANFLVLQMANDEIDRVSSIYKAEMEQAIERHNEELVKRLTGPLANLRTIAERLLAGDGPKVHKSLIRNIEDAVRVLPHLNLTDNVAIGRMVEQAHDLTTISTDDLKDSRSTQQDAIAKVNAIMDNMKGYMAAIAA